MSRPPLIPLSFSRPVVLVPAGQAAAASQYRRRSQLQCGQEPDPVYRRRNGYDHSDHVTHSTGPEEGADGRGGGACVRQVRVRRAIKGGLLKHCWKLKSKLSTWPKRLLGKAEITNEKKATYFLDFKIITYLTTLYQFHLARRPKMKIRLLQWSC